MEAQLESLRQMIISEETRIVLTFAQSGVMIGCVWALASAYFKIKNDRDLYEKDKSIYIRDREQNEETISTMKNEIKEIKNEHIDIKVTQAKIDTELKGINLGIKEIKALFMKHVDK